MTKLEELERYKEYFESKGWEVFQNTEFYTDAIEKKDRKINWEIERRSPLGEDVVETIYCYPNYLDIFDELANIYYNFDEEEHSAFWFENREKIDGVPSLKELLEDAYEIKEMYRNLFFGFSLFDPERKPAL
jgi:hypothetical protein